MQGRRPPPLHEPIRKISSKPKNTTRGGLRRFCRVDTANTIENPRSAHFSPMRSMLLNGVTQNGNRKIGVAGKKPKRGTWRLPVSDRKSTRLNSSHQIISYAVFCLKKKKQHTRRRRR